MSWGRDIGKVDDLRVQSASTASQLGSCVQLISWSLQWQRVIGRAITVLVLHPCQFFVWTFAAAAAAAAAAAFQLVDLHVVIADLDRRRHPSIRECEHRALSPHFASGVADGLSPNAQKLCFKFRALMMFNDMI